MMLLVIVVLERSGAIDDGVDGDGAIDDSGDGAGEDGGEGAGVDQVIRKN